MATDNSTHVYNTTASYNPTAVYSNPATYTPIAPAYSTTPAYNTTPAYTSPPVYKHTSGYSSTPVYNPTSVYNLTAASQIYSTSNVTKTAITPAHAPVPVSSFSALSGALDPITPPTQRHSNSRVASPSTTSRHDAPTSRRARSNPKPTPKVGSKASSKQSPSAIKACSSKKLPRFERNEIFPVEPAPYVAPLGPAKHVAVPQRAFSETSAPQVYEPRFRRNPLEFQMMIGAPPGVRVGAMMKRSTPSIAGGAVVFGQPGEHEVRLWILWPGYGREPMSRRMATLDGGIRRDTVLMFIANMVLDFVDMIRKKRVEVDPGYEDWSIGRRADGRHNIVGEGLYITRMVHRGGSNWQPEIWAPRKR